MAKKKKKKLSEYITNSKRELIQWLFISLTIAIIGGYLYKHFLNTKQEDFKIDIYNLPSAVLLTDTNYGKQIDSLSIEFNLPSNYLKAIIALECSGKLNFKPRYEKRVFESLQEVRDSIYDHFGTITTNTIKDASDAALKNLASSWGPFQLMGYQCIELGVNVKDIRSQKALYWGVYWINKRYGKYLRKGKYKDAFHIHNTGKPIPLFGEIYTHDPDYIKKGMMYMSCFELN